MLKSRLEAGFNGGGGEYDTFINDGDGDTQELIRRLLGSPALVWQLEGHSREIAITAYQDALRTMFLAAFALSAIMAFVQAGTGSKGAVESAESENNDLTSEVDQAAESED